MENIRAYSALLKKYGKPFIMDVCRFSENAMFIKMREPGYENTPIRDIVKEMFSYCDGCTMSAKKDGMVNIGGFIVLRSEEWMDAVRNGLIMMEGFPPTVVWRAATSRPWPWGWRRAWMKIICATACVPLNTWASAWRPRAWVSSSPPGAMRSTSTPRRCCPACRWNTTLPGRCATRCTWRGIRGVEIGSVMFGKRLDSGVETYHSMELVRLAFPRRMYTQSHFDYAAEVIAEVIEGIQHPWCEDHQAAAVPAPFHL